MLSLSLKRTDTDSLYCNPTEDGSSTKTAPSIKSIKSSTTTSSASSVKSGAQSTKSRSTTKSKSSTASIPKSANWKAATDPLGMSSKSMGSGFMFSTNLYSPGFQVPAAAAGGGPKAHQTKQLKFVEKKRTGSSAASTKSGKSGKSEKTAVSSSDKSVKSSSSSTKSTFLSSFAGSFSTQGEPASSLPEKKPGSSDGDGKSSSKSDASKESTKMRDTDSAIGLSAPSSTYTTAELTVVVEDHSSPDMSVHPFDKSALGSPDVSRRPSIAESISQLQPSTQRPPHTPNELLLKRVISWEYLGRVHHGKMAYYNTIMLTEADLRKFYTPEAVQKRTHQYFFLGTSIANILDIPHLSDYARSLSAILHEYEHFQSAETKSKMNFFKGGRKVSDGRSFEETEEYVHFEVRTLPFEMDYTVVFATLCEMIAKAYKKFDTRLASVVIDSDVFHKIEVRLKKIMNNATRELESLAREAMQEELNSLDPVAGIMAGWDQQVLALGH